MAEKPKNVNLINVTMVISVEWSGIQMLIIGVILLRYM